MRYTTFPRDGKVVLEIVNDDTGARDERVFDTQAEAAKVQNEMSLAGALKFVEPAPPGERVAPAHDAPHRDHHEKPHPKKKA